MLCVQVFLSMDYQTHESLGNNERKERSVDSYRRRDGLVGHWMRHLQLLNLPIKCAVGIKLKGCQRLEFLQQIIKEMECSRYLRTPLNQSDNG